MHVEQASDALEKRWTSAPLAFSFSSGARRLAAVSLGRFFALIVSPLSSSVVYKYTLTLMYTSIMYQMGDHRRWGIALSHVVASRGSHEIGALKKEMAS